MSDLYSSLLKRPDLFPFYGWAPGNYYMRECPVTGEGFIGDKHSTNSLTAAIQKAKDDVRSLLTISHQMADMKVQHRKDVEALNATILSQAREIERLKDQA